MSKSTSAPHTELSPEDLELLERVRRSLVEESVPGPVRQRMLARVVDEAVRGEQRFVVPAELVPIQRRGWGSGVWLLAAAAFGLVLLAGARGLFRGRPDPALTADASSKAAPPTGLGAGLLHLPIFRAPAQQLPAGALALAGANLFGERPFSAQSRAWQVRRWDDLRGAPMENAAHDFVEGALCVALGGGERVLGGWPWLGPGSATDGRGSSSSQASSVEAPLPVALGAGRPYRLMFKAWAREPLPAQVLIAVGHARLPFSGRGGARVPVSTTPQPFVVDFVSSADDPSVGVAFLATGAAGEERTRVCLSDVTLTEG